MRAKQMIERAKGWIAPKYPGYGKEAMVGFASGLILGAIGVGIFLRSLFDGFAVAMIVGTLVTMWDSPLVFVAGSLFSAAWCTARVYLDTWRYNRDHPTKSVDDESADPQLSQPAGVQ